MANKVLINNKQKEVKVPSGTRLLIRRCCNAVLLEEKFEKGAEISVCFVDNDEIRQLNREFRKIDSVTDVLSFPAADDLDHLEQDEETGLYLLGDVVICMPRAVEQAESFGHSLQREIAFLTVHSVLHLLGYDHESGGLEQVRMREKEELVLTQIGVPRGLNYVPEKIE